jgi:hypothetical protein
MITTHKVAARPTQERHTERAYNIHDIPPKTSLVAERRLLFVDAAINTATEMLDKAAIDSTVNVANFTVKVNLDPGHKYPPSLLRIGLMPSVL